MLRECCYESYFLFGSVFFNNTTVFAHEDCACCDLSGLVGYTLTLSFSEDGEDGEVLEGQIYVPKISEIKDIFCGRWYVNGLSEGVHRYSGFIRPYKGYKESDIIYISLDPYVEYAGLVLELSNINSWPQQGVLFEAAIGPVIVGKFTIEKYNIRRH